jgi:hypothetical protein
VSSAKTETFRSCSATRTPKPDEKANANIFRFELDREKLRRAIRREDRPLMMARFSRYVEKVFDWSAQLGGLRDGRSAQAPNPL